MRENVGTVGGMHFCCKQIKQAVASGCVPFLL